MPGSIDPVPTGSMGGSGRFARSGIGGGASTVTDDVGVVEAGVDDVGVAATAGGDVGGGAATVTDDVGVVEAGVDDVGVDDVGVAATAGGGGVTAATAGGELGGPAARTGRQTVASLVGGGVAATAGGDIGGGAATVTDDVGVVEAGVDIVPAPVHLPNTSALRTLTITFRYLLGWVFTRLV